MIESGLHDYLFDAIKAEASDLHVTVGLPPMIRVHGKVQPLEYPTLTPNEERHEHVMSVEDPIEFLHSHWCSRIY
jgi:twitching motility protein PilT